MNNRILFVDDEANILRAMERMLRNHRGVWEMHFVQGVEEAIEKLLSLEFDVVISDISMPGRDGFDLLATTRGQERTRDIPFLIVTGLNDADLKRKALDLGATDLLNKPVIHEDLIARINSMLRIKAQQDEIKARNLILDHKVRQRTAELELARLDLIWRLGRAAEYRDTDTGNHVVRVGYYCKVMAENLGLDREFSQRLFLTSPLHDIGKIGIPDSILLKQGKLNPDEWDIMKSHCQIGGYILRQETLKCSAFGKFQDLFKQPDPTKNENPFLKMAEKIALTHHERWDGNGYPLGLSKKEIPLESRVVAIADVYDALFSKRPYKQGFGEAKVMEIMTMYNGSQFDPHVFSCFEKNLDLFHDIRSQFAG